MKHIYDLAVGVTLVSLATWAVLRVIEQAWITYFLLKGEL